MTRAELEQAAIDCLGMAFKREDIPAHVVQAAVSIVLMLTPAMPSQKQAA